jgi:hypothetical protein
MSMPRIRGIAVVLALGAAVMACTLSNPAQVAGQENQMAAAGFVQRPANTPERRAMMQRLPPHRFVRQVANDRVTWLYADPTICNCLYVGGQQAYGRYQQQVFAQRIADERLMTAQVNADSAYAWDWGPWGGPDWGYY